MKILKKDLLYIAIAFFISSILFFLSFINENSTFIFSIEIFTIAFIFCWILFIYRDRFNVFTFLLINLSLGVLDIIFVALKIRIVQNYYSIQIYEKALFIIIIWILLFAISYKIFTKKGLGLKFTNTIDKIFNYTSLKMLIIIVGIIYIYLLFIKY